MNMLHDSWWISTIDHRVSTALVFFLLLMTMGNGHKKPYFPLRILVSFIALCAVSWLTRFPTYKELFLPNPPFPLWKESC